MTESSSIWGFAVLGVAAVGLLIGQLRGVTRRKSLIARVDELTGRLREYESRLGATRQELDAILQSMDGGVIVLDMQHRVLSLNRAAEAMLLLGEPQARGRLLQEAVRQPELNRFVAGALAGKPEQPDLSLLGDPPRQVRAIATVLRDAGARPAGLLVVLDDVTQLRKLESVRSDFAANVSHELRTPITNIKGYVETLIETDFTRDAEQARQFLGVIAKNTDRLGAIVEDMLMLTQLESPDTRESLSTERTSIPQIVESAAGALEHEARAKSIAIVRDIPRDLFAQVNQQLIEQALSNIIANAIRYSPAGTRVQVFSSRAVGKLSIEHVEIAVTDEGPGMADEHLQRIFERFYRIDRARSRERGGTGLGLAIVKHIVQLHLGRVEVESVVGKGSTFRLILPVERPV